MIMIGLGLVARSPDSAPPPEPTGTLTLAEPARDRLIHDSGAALGNAAAVIPISGTGTPGEAVEARAVSLEDGGSATTVWTEIATIAGDGTWSASLTVPRAPTWYVAQARLVAEPVVLATAAHRFGVGHVLALWGQSEFARFWTASSDVLTPAAITDDEAVQMFWHDRATPGAGGVQQHFVAEGDTGTAAFAAMAASLIAARPGEKFAILHHTQSGTSFQDLCDDAQGVRSFADDQALHDHVTPDGVSVGLVWPSWFASPRGYQTDYAEAFQAVFTGTTPAGSPIAPGTTLFAGQGSTEFTLDHSLADLYDPAETVIALAGPHRFSPAAGDAHNASGLAAIENCRISLRGLLATNTSPFTLVPGAEALDYLNGEPQTAGSYDPAGTGWGDTAHPNRRTEDGQNRLARITAQGMLQAAGLQAWTIPVFDASTWTETTITVTSSAGPVTTKALADGGPASVAGFDLNGQQVTTASIVDGAVEITGAFSNTDTLTFGRWGATGMRTHPDDYFADLWAAYPLVAHSLPDLEGIAVRPLPDPAALANTLTAAASFVTGTADFRFDDPATLGANSGVWVGIADITTAASLANGTLFGLSGGNIKIEILANGRLRANIKDASNTTVVANAISGSGAIVAGNAHLIAAHVDLGAGYARIWIDGALVIDAGFTATDPGFATNRRLGFLADPQTFTNHLSGTEVRRLALWRSGANLAGAEPAGPADKEISIANPAADPWYVSA